MDSLNISKNYTGRIGLNWRAFATSADGETTDETAEEYRDTYLKIGASNVSIGDHDGTGSPAGSQRIMLNLDTTSSQVVIHDTASTSAELGLPAVRLLCVNAATDLHVRRASAGVGVAIDKPGEVSTFGDIYVTAAGTSSRVIAGEGVTLTNWIQDGGDNTLRAAAADLTKYEVRDGNLTVEGDFKVTTALILGGTVYDNHINSDSTNIAIGTVNIEGGVLDGLGSSVSREWDVMNQKGGTVKADSNVVTVNTWNVQPNNRAYSTTLTDA